MFSSPVRSYHRCPVGLVIVAALLGGCWTSKDDGLAMRRDLDQLKNHLSRDVENSRKERKKLQQVMEQATALLTRNSADVGAQVDRLQARIDKLTGLVDEQQKTVNDLNKQMADLTVKVDQLASRVPPPVTNQIPTDKEALFKLASSKLAAGDHADARVLLRRFRSMFPNDPRVDQAQLMLGDSWYTEQKFAPAIVEYKKIVERHKKSRVYPDALFKIGMAWYQLKYCSEAKLFLTQLIKRHRRHSQVKRAKKVLRLIKRYRRKRDVCR